MYDGGAPTSRFGTGPAHTVAMRLFDLAPGNDATARRAPGTYEYARPTGAASRVLWDHSSELISLLAASGTATICVEGAAEGKALRSRLYKLARLDAVAAAPDVYEFQGDADPLGLDRYGLGLLLVPAEASELLAFAGDRSPSTLTRALEMQALPAAQAVSHYRASLAKRPQTHGDWHKADIKRGAQTKAVNLAQSQHITLEESQSLVAQHPACPCPTCGHTAFRPDLMKVCVPALYTVT
ncbi:hypothetical protein T492DRAFT_1069872 [Pavlovales sp. CCMP2436]|nr:hypothetical protein T492DRAFT_1069872 [Pavlovales sp. CCMP2436]